MLWARIVFWVNLAVIGFALLVLSVSENWTSLPYCLNFISAGVSMFALVGLLGSENSFGPPMVQIISGIGAATNLATIGIGIAILVRVDLPYSSQAALVVIAVGLLNLAYIVIHVDQIRAAGFPTRE